MLKEIATWLAARCGFTLGATMEFGHRKQTSADRCVLVAFNGGGATYPELPERIDQMVQILARSTSYMEAYEDSMTIFSSIHGRAALNMTVLVSGQLYEAQVIAAVNAPQYIGPDENGRHEWSTNYVWRMKSK